MPIYQSQISLLTIMLKYNVTDTIPLLIMDNINITYTLLSPNLAYSFLSDTISSDVEW